MRAIISLLVIFIAYVVYMSYNTLQKCPYNTDNVVQIEDEAYTRGCMYILDRAFKNPKADYWCNKFLKIDKLTQSNRYGKTN
jgi:hypothetical protein